MLINFRNFPAAEIYIVETTPGRRPDSHVQAPETSPDPIFLSLEVNDSLLLNLPYEIVARIFNIRQPFRKVPRARPVTIRRNVHVKRLSGRW